MIHTYRTRLIFYNALLMIFLVSILGYTYIYSHNVIIEEAEIYGLNLSNLLRSNIEMEEEKLLHYTEVVRDDLIIQEYMFITTEISGEKEALWSLYRRNFGWLPIQRTAFIDNNGKAIVGEEHRDLIQAVNNRTGMAREGAFYFQGKENFERVTWARIYFQGSPRGIVALTHPLDRTWLERHRFFGGYYLLVDDDGRISLSNLPDAEGQRFQPDNGLITINERAYHVRAIPLSNKDGENERLWLAISEQELLDKLARHSGLILLLALVGGTAILITGLLIIRNFNRPLQQLMQITQAVTEGELPKLQKSSATDEINTLVNRFAEMLTALRSKQAEIERVHRKLEENAITDALTGLYNRHHLTDLFPKLLAQAQREEKWLCGLLLDLDYFKRINDEHGHPAGDRCLAHAGELLRELSRASDYIFRIGGEEFLMLSINDSAEGALVLAEKIRRSFEAKECITEGSAIPMTTSIGVSCADPDHPAKQALSSLLSQTDKALYRAKALGRNRVVAFNEIEETTL
ncbi:diguanylate cyclase/phosphodiesterase (GGDEF & EAL domains) with PAS/PAC sensor(s) [hydrothermal vent metagenome]|uniref:Diguanylate cyclase/phosphodiesterase (GGDEF & EAL domains) with PAS/PAC sensor(S) n=1 Tax=hydrothermal vent metagenome TaxID=652676 RepID=A0A3B1AX42_9ZZZZ